MGWTPLKDRIDDLPLILCGPILRRTEPDSVTVWVALKESRNVTLNVYTRSTGIGDSIGSGTRSTVKFGEYLHIVAVTARFSGSNRLAPDTLYFYNLVFDNQDDLHTPGILTKTDEAGHPIKIVNITYHDFDLPSFALPPSDLNDLRIIHGSCRKAHAKGLDALPALDLMIDSNATDPAARPHQLFLTGDQIYADDIADSLLYILIDSGDTILDWAEELPGERPPGYPTKFNELRPAYRSGTVIIETGFTSEDTKSHLLSLGEFYSMYLLNWSDVLWPEHEKMPQFEDIFFSTDPQKMKRLETKHCPDFEKEQKRLHTFFEALPQVRRALANIPVYMIFDDHEVTDDWNISRDWCEVVYNKPLGRRAVQNALLAYAIFQDWGNNPASYEDGEAGAALLTAASSWVQSQGTNLKEEQDIARRVGIPGLRDPKRMTPFALTHEGGDTNVKFDEVYGVKQLSRSDDALDWHYTVSGQNHEVLVLDTRTSRAYPGGSFDPPILMSSTAFEAQIPENQAKPNSITFVVAPTNLIVLPPFDHWLTRFILWFKRKLPFYLVYYLSLGSIYDRRKHPIYNPELADSWEGPRGIGFETIIARLAARAPEVGNERRSRILILTGDVHMSWVSRLQYWANRPFNVNSSAKQLNVIFAHLCSSSLRKQTGGTAGTEFPHDIGYGSAPEAIWKIIFDAKWPWQGLPEPRKWVGWQNEPQIDQALLPESGGANPEELQKLHAIARDLDLERLRGSPSMLKVTSVQPTSVYPVTPDWRYRIDFILAESYERELFLNSVAPMGSADVEAPPPGDRREELWHYLTAANKKKYFHDKWASGKEIIGVNNIGEITFEGSEEEKTVIQEFWWRLKSPSDDEQFLHPFPLSKFRVSLRYDDPKYEPPQLSQGSDS